MWKRMMSPMRIAIPARSIRRTARECSGMDASIEAVEAAPATGCGRGGARAPGADTRDVAGG
jgi:hypothetical protein